LSTFQCVVKIILVCAPWPKATVKSPVGACIFTLYFLLPWTPCPTLPCPAPALPCLCPCPALFQIYLLLPRTGGGNYTGNFFSFCYQGQEEEVTQGTLLLLLPSWEVLRLWIPWKLEVELGSTVRLWPGWMKRPSGWIDDSSGGRSQGLLHLHPQKYTGAKLGVASPKAFIYRLCRVGFNFRFILLWYIIAILWILEMKWWWWIQENKYQLVCIVAFPMNF
jgi:hypothetical protein